MPSFSAVLGTPRLIVGVAERTIFPDAQNCELTVSEVNLFAPITHARLRAVSRTNACKSTSVSKCYRRFSVPRAVDQSQAQSGEDYRSEGVDDNNAAGNAAEIAEDTIHGVADDQRKQSKDVADEADNSSSDQHPQSNGSVLHAVTNSATKAAETMQRNLQMAEEFITGTSENAKDSGDWGDEAIEENVDEQLDWKNTTEEMHESGKQLITDDNNAAENAAGIEMDTMSGLAKSGQEEAEDTSAEDEGPSEEFGGQTRRFQENVQGQAQGFVESMKSGASKASEQVQAAGRDMLHLADNALGRSHDEGDDEEVLGKILILKPEDFEEAYIEIDDGSAKESILL